MPSFAHEQVPFKLPSNHCKFLPCFVAHEHPPNLPTNACKSLFSLLQACVRCSHGLCCRIPSSLSSEEDCYPDSPESNLDHSHVIILEIRSRAKAKTRLKDYSFGESLCWVFSPTSGKLLIAPKSVRNEELQPIAPKVGRNHEEEDEFDDAITFYSMKSCFSRCSSDAALSAELKELIPVSKSIWDEFRHCEGWPFGLCRRAVMLPPLPSSPSDSWTWRNRNHVAKI